MRSRFLTPFLTLNVDLASLAEKNLGSSPDDARSSVVARRRTGGIRASA